LSEHENQAETASSAQPTSEAAVSGASTSSETASNIALAGPVAGAESAAQPAAEVETKADEAEEKKETVRYELLDATPRAGSIVDIKFKVPYEEYDRKTQKFYKDLRQTVIIDGFRPGKAPLKLIQNRYHKEVKQDTLDYLAENCLEQITVEKGYVVLREFDRVDPEVADGQEMVFAVSLEIRPKIEPTGYDRFDITVDAVEITEAMVEAETEELRRRHGTYQTTDLLAWEPGLGLTMDMRVTDDKTEEIPDATPEDSFLEHPEDVLPEQVIEQLRGRRAGDLVVARVLNERRSEGGVVLSQHDNYAIKILEVKREVLPELNDQFAQDVGGLKTLQELHDQIRKGLTDREEKEVRDQALEKIYGQLFERNLFDVPQMLVTQTAQDLARDRRQRLLQMGFSLEDLGETMESHVADAMADAERMIRIVLLKGAIADKEKIVPTDEDVERAIARQAEQEGRRPLAVRARLEAQKGMGRFRDNLKYDLVDDFLLKRANVSKQFVMAESRILTPGGA
jgi:trigger factor